MTLEGRGPEPARETQMGSTRGRDVELSISARILANIGNFVQIE